jgi:hypothetical protein
MEAGSLILVHGLDIRIIDAATGELLRELVLDPTKRYQATGQPPGPAARRPTSGEPTQTRVHKFPMSWYITVPAPVDLNQQAGLSE